MGRRPKLLSGGTRSFFAAMRSRRAMRPSRVIERKAPALRARWVMLLVGGGCQMRGTSRRGSAEGETARR